MSRDAVWGIRIDVGDGVGDDVADGDGDGVCKCFGRNVIRNVGGGVGDGVSDGAGDDVDDGVEDGIGDGVGRNVAWVVGGVGTASMDASLPTSATALAANKKVTVPSKCSRRVPCQFTRTACRGRARRLQGGRRHGMRLVPCPRDSLHGV